MLMHFRNFSNYDILIFCFGNGHAPVMPVRSYFISSYTAEKQVKFTERKLWYKIDFIYRTVYFYR